MEFKHKELLNEFNRQVQSGEYEKGWWKWESRLGDVPTVWVGCSFDWPAWSNNLEYRCVMSDKHPDNSLLDVGDIVKSWFFTAVIAKIDNKPNDSEKYFAVIIANEGKGGKALSNYIGQILDGVVAETRKQITKHFSICCEVIKKSK